MTFPLELQPSDKIIFKDAKIGEEDVTIDININNPTEISYAIKLNCSSNDLFRIDTPVAALGGGKQITIKITFKGRVVPDKLHHIDVYCFKVADADDKAKPRELWTAHKGTIESKRLSIEIGKPEAPGEKKDAKREKDKKKAKTDVIEKKGAEKKEEKPMTSRKNKVLQMMTTKAMMMLDQ